MRTQWKVIVTSAMCLAVAVALVDGNGVHSPAQTASTAATPMDEVMMAESVGTEVEVHCDMCCEEEHWEYGSALCEITTGEECVWDDCYRIIGKKCNDKVDTFHHGECHSRDDDVCGIVQEEVQRPVKVTTTGYECEEKDTGCNSDNCFNIYEGTADCIDPGDALMRTIELDYWTKCASLYDTCN